jgi:CubicO group peptidase (beta-lactamase class C family)
VNWAARHAPEVLAATQGAVRGRGIMAAVAAVDAGGPVIAASDGMPAGGRFEIGSVTKTMTATLLAGLAADGTVALDDPVGRWLDAGPNAGITLAELATHSSGLPRLAPGQPLLSPNPYVRFTADKAEKGLRAAARAPGSPHRYSNFGFQLLGLVLERASGRSYQQLLAERLLEPLGMRTTAVGAAAGPRLTGHAHGWPHRHWDVALPGPGGVEASIGDLARYLAACLSPPEGPLGAAIECCQQPRVQISEARASGLAWIIAGGRHWHNGGTGGFSACVGIDRPAGRAIGVLVNAGRVAATLSDPVVTALNAP